MYGEGRREREEDVKRFVEDKRFILPIPNPSRRQHVAKSHLMSRIPNSRILARQLPPNFGNLAARAIHVMLS